MIRSFIPIYLVISTTTICYLSLLVWLNNPTKYSRSFACIISLMLFITALYLKNSYSIFTIEQSSMCNTLLPGDRILVKKTHNPTYKNGDIIVFTEPEMGNMNLVKRIIGVPGDSIVITDIYLYIISLESRKSYDTIIFFNDSLAQNSMHYPNIYNNSISKIPDENISESNIRLTDSYYFVIGDNHEYSIDSRNFGPVFSTHIIGKTEMILYSSHLNRLNFNRLMKIIKGK